MDDWPTTTADPALTTTAQSVTGRAVVVSVLSPVNLRTTTASSDSASQHALVAQLAEATVSNTVKCRFESDLGHTRLPKAFLSGALRSRSPGDAIGAD